MPEPPGLMLVGVRVIPQAIFEVFALEGALDFGGKDVDLGLREVGDPADVVEVEVRRDDMAHVLGRKTKGLDLLEGRDARLRRNPKERRRHKAKAPAGMREIVAPKARIDQDQAVVCFEKQDVRDKLFWEAGEFAPHKRTRRSAREVMDLHARTPWIERKRKYDDFFGGQNGWNLSSA